MMTTTSMTCGAVTGQLEIGLPAAPVRGRGRRVLKKAPASRARWWFSRMRQVVEAAAEWTPPPGSVGAAAGGGLGPAWSRGA